MWSMSAFLLWKLDVGLFGSGGERWVAVLLCGARAKGAECRLWIVVLEHNNT